MYYIFDAALGSLSFNKTLQELNAELNRANIQGEQARVTGIRKIPELCRDAVIKKYDTVVIVGTGKTLAEAIGPALVNNLTLGFIPIDVKEPIATVLGLTSHALAAHAIARRLAEDVTVLQINDRFCLTSCTATIPQRKAQKKSFFSSLLGSEEEAAIKLRLQIDERYTISVPVSELTIYNLFAASSNTLVQPERINPHDTCFEIAFRVKSDQLSEQFLQRGYKKKQIKTLSPYSIIRATTATIEAPKNIALASEGAIIAKTPATIGIPTRKLRLILGRERRF